MPATPVYIICSPRPQVGKTLTRAAARRIPAAEERQGEAFDINLKEPSLLDYLPDVTETADVIDTYGKMQLMDRIIVDDGLAKVIDLGFHAFDEFFKMTEQIGFLKEAARRNVAPIILFMADTDRLSARGHEMLRQQIPPSKSRSWSTTSMWCAANCRTRCSAAASCASRRCRRSSRPISTG